MSHARDPLDTWFRRAGRTLLGYSGGVDSAVLAVAGTRVLGADLLAVIGRSPSYPAEQWRRARDLAAEHGVAVLEVETRELDDPDYRRNPVDRCFFCKRELWDRLGRIAAERGFAVMIDGTNADDLGEHRPGLAAGAARGIRSPLAELGFTKAMVRARARALGLPLWDAPAAPCLSSRIRYGLEVTPERLEQVERAEALLRRLGVTGNLRVRHHGATARIEADPAAFPVLEAEWPRIEAGLTGLGFGAVERDPAGYRRGSLLPG
jgi:pyridinium-3,5-biscarboxylic acid mononucleotide sulfurtransferase